MRGFVPTPGPVVDLMVDKLFRDRQPTAASRVLDPGSGRGAFIDGILRWCARQQCPVPQIVAVESDPVHVAELRVRFGSSPRIDIREADFLKLAVDRFDFVIGNPPYIPITELSIEERARYNVQYSTASNRFDLYMLFFEQALRQLSPGGRLVFITPEKFLYVGSAAPLRRLLLTNNVEELHFLDEQTFGDLVTYPLVSSVRVCPSRRSTEIIHRDRRRSSVVLDSWVPSWLPAILGAEPSSTTATLADTASRISCGVATGADSVFLVRDSALPTELIPFAYPTVSGRELGPGKRLHSLSSLLLPYSEDGRLLDESALGALGAYLSVPSRRGRLLARTCVTRKPWYAFHETPPLEALLKPKILCKDIGASPFFIADDQGTIVPRHSVYYIVPERAGMLEPMIDYLNSPAAQQWLRQNCQRATNGFIRLQSHVLKWLPIPALLAAEGSIEAPAVMAQPA